MDMQQEITIPGTKKKIPLKIILLGGAAVIILYFVTRNKSGTAPSYEEQGDFDQKLQDQYNALSELITPPGTPPSDPITNPIDIITPPITPPTTGITDYPEYVPIPTFITTPEVAATPSPTVTPQAQVTSPMATFQPIPYNLREALQASETVVFSRTPGVRPVTTLRISTAEHEASIRADTPTVGRKMTDQVATAPLDRLPGKRVDAPAPVKNVARVQVQKAQPPTATQKSMPKVIAKKSPPPPPKPKVKPVSRRR